MDNDTKHVLTILGLVGCFGAGYFVCKAENKDTLRTGEKFGVFTQIENKIDGKTNMSFRNENKAVENAVDSYYQTADSYFDYFYDDGTKEITETYDYSDKYQIIDNIAYINCSHFDFSATQGFVHFFMDNPSVDGFIIDLRENSGGYTDYCTNMLGHFIPAQNIIKYYYNDGKTEDISVTNVSELYTQNVAVLVNGNTMSAAEIFTSAMKQFYSGDVVTIGTQTYGKGSFQLNEHLSKNEIIRYTVGYYTVGDWDCYDGIGITPDIEIPMDYDPDIICTDDDVQLQTALDLFK